MSILASYHLSPEGRWHVVVSKRLSGVHCVVLDAKFATEAEAKVRLLSFLTSEPLLAPVESRNV